MSERIGPYVLTKPLTNANAGNCRWGFARRGTSDQEYFIKELLDPVYPIDEENLSPQVVARKQKLCQRFEASESLVLKRINESSDGNMMRIVDFFRYGSKYYLVAEKTEAGDFEKLKHLPYEARLNVCRVLAHALMGLHEAGLVNGDIKLSNILPYKTRNGGISARIIDVDGCYWKATPPSNPDDITTDQAYMAPEVFLFIRDESGIIDEKSDVFSLGLCIHEILAGEPVRLAADCHYPFQHVIEHGRLPLSNELPVAERGLIAQMLAEKPADRPSARQVFLELWHGSPPCVGETGEKVHEKTGRNAGVKLPDIESTRREGSALKGMRKTMASPGTGTTPGAGATGRAPDAKGPSSAAEGSWFKKAGGL